MQILDILLELLFRVKLICKLFILIEQIHYLYLI